MTTTMITAAASDFSPPRPKGRTLARRLRDGLADALDAAALLVMILLCLPWLWICCREEERDRRLKAADGGVR